MLLVDDAPELRVLVRQALEERGDFEVVAEADDGARAVSAAAEHRPDLVVLDLGLGDLAGRDLLTRLREAAPSAKVVVYSGSPVPDRLELGRQVAGYADKRKDVRYLVDLLVDLTRQGVRSASIRLGPGVGDVARGREFVVERCAEWGCDALVDNARIVTSELVSNAFLHAHSTCELAVRLVGPVLRLEARDDGGGSLEVKSPGAREERGRGLFLVSVLCTAWGTEYQPSGGKLVWAELSVTPGGTDGDERTDRVGAAASGGRRSPARGPDAARDDEGEGVRSDAGRARLRVVSGRAAAAGPSARTAGSATG